MWCCHSHKTLFQLALKLWLMREIFLEHGLISTSAGWQSNKKSISECVPALQPEMFATGYSRGTEDCWLSHLTFTSCQLCQKLNFCPSVKKLLTPLSNMTCSSTIFCSRALKCLYSYMHVQGHVNRGQSDKNSTIHITRLQYLVTIYSISNSTDECAEGHTPWRCASFELVTQMPSHHLLFLFEYKYTNMFRDANLRCEGHSPDPGLLALSSCMAGTGLLKRWQKQNMAQTKTPEGARPSWNMRRIQSHFQTLENDCFKVLFVCVFGSIHHKCLQLNCLCLHCNMTVMIVTSTCTNQAYNSVTHAFWILTVDLHSDSSFNLL